MKRALALAAIALALGTAISGCRGVREARPPQQPAAVQTSPAPRAGQQPAAGSGTGSADVSGDLSDVDKMLSEMDEQLAKADATPADGD